LNCTIERSPLRWGNVDLDIEKVIRVREALEQTKAGGLRFKAPKTRAGQRDVTLPDIVIEALREHRRQQLELRMALGLGKLSDDALAFPALNGGPQSPRMFSKKWSVTADSLGTGNLTFHAFTHSRITADRSRDRYCDDQQANGARLS
jgi:integrase